MYRIGQVEGDRIDWLGESSSYNTRAVAPAIACNDATAVEIHSSETGKALSASVLTLPASRPRWFEKRGQYSYLYFSMGVEESFERTVTTETIKIELGAPFLIASLSKSQDSAAFPSGAMLTITAPDGTAYNDVQSGGSNMVIKSGASLQNLVVREPMAGDYRVSLSVPTNVTFLFVFETLPFRNVLDTIKGSGGLQKREGSAEQPGAMDVIAAMARVWVNYRAGIAGLEAFAQAVHYVTDSDMDVQNQPGPANMPDAVQAIVQNVNLSNFRQMIQPPNVPTRPITNGPIVGYVRNQAGALQWLHAEIRQEHLDTGTTTNDNVRRFARRLGLPTDQAGHAIAARLGGTGTQEWNIFPQVGGLNMGAYRNDIEDLIYRAVNNQGSARVWLIFHYDDPLLPNRPTRFDEVRGSPVVLRWGLSDILFRLPDGTEYINDLYNPEFVPRGS